MTNRPDLGHFVTEWLHDDASSAGSDRVLAAALVRVSSVRQDGRRPAWVHVERHTYAGLAVAAAAVLAVAFVGLNLQGSDRAGVGTSAALPSPSSSVGVGAYPPADSWLAGRHSVAVDGVPLSFEMPGTGWESHDPVYLSRSTHGPQGAEAIVLWTSLPDGRAASLGPYQICHDLLGGSPGSSSLADIAATVSTVAGTDLVDGPADVTVGGRAAKQVTFFVTYSILDNQSVCWPGYFLSWDDHQGGAMWDSLLPGDTVRVWIVDVDGQRLFIEAVTHWDAGDGVQQEIQQMIDSIRFE